MKTVKILIGDDHRIVREGLKQVLADAPEIEVVAEAETGPDILARVDVLGGNAGLDAVLLDIALPDRDGMDVLQALKKSWRSVRNWGWRPTRSAPTAPASSRKPAPATTWNWRFTQNATHGRHQAIDVTTGVTTGRELVLREGKSHLMHRSLVAAYAVLSAGARWHQP